MVSLVYSRQKLISLYAQRYDVEGDIIQGDQVNMVISATKIKEMLYLPHNPTTNFCNEDKL